MTEQRDARRRGWRIAIVGSRNYPDLSDVDAAISGIGDHAAMASLSPEYVTIVSGGALGVDRRAARAARDEGFTVLEIRPDYDRYGRGAPLERNKLIIAEADSVIAFWDGESRGTRQAIEQALIQRKRLEVRFPDSPHAQEGDAE